MDDRSFHVKDKRMGQLLLIRHNYGELYYIRVAPHVTLKLVFYGEQTTSDVFHAHLGHTLLLYFMFWQVSAIYSHHWCTFI